MRPDQHVLLCALCLLAGFSLYAQSTLADLGKRGNALIAKKAIPEAEQHFRDAAQKAHAAGEPVWEAEFVRAIGETFERRSDYLQARTHYQRALQIRLGLAPSKENTSEIVRLNAGIGMVSFYLRDDKAAIVHARKAVEGYRELGDRNRQARNLNLLGMILLNSKETVEAEKSLEQALAIYESIPDKAGVAACMTRLSQIAGGRGDYRAALEWAFRAQAVYPATENPRQTAEILEILGNTFSRMQQQDKALEYHRACLPLRLKLNDPRALAQTHSNIGAILAIQGEWESALGETTQALEIRRKLNSPADVAADLINLGSIQMSLNRKAEARKAFLESLEICEKHNYSREAAPSYDSLGTISRDEGSLADALRYHTQGLRLNEQLADRLGMVKSLTNLASDLELQGDLGGALQHLDTALSTWTELSRQVADPSQIGNFRKAANSLYQRYARVLVRSGRVEEALRISELARGLGLSRMSRLTTTGFTELLEPEDRQAWIAATGELGKAANRLRTVSETKQSTERQADAEAIYFEAERGLRRLQDRIFATNPKLQTDDSTAMDTAFLRQFAKANPRTLVISWMILDDSHSLLFSVSGKDGVRVVELPAGRKAIQTATQDWLNAIGRRQGRGVTAQAQASRASEPQLAAALFQLVFGPVQRQMLDGRYSRLALLPDGGLTRVPFGALMDGGGKRLLERYAIVTGVAFRSLQSQPVRRRGSVSLYAIGDPLAPKENRLVVPFGARFNPLPHAREEARSLVKYFPDGQVALGQDAREGEVKKALGKASILHFATHGLLAPGDGLRSGLLLSTEPDDSREDGLLQAWEISGMALSARLAVLSACDTGQGDEQLGEGVIGLAWAFQAAGCANVIASLWSVDDAAARHLMMSFYRHLKAHLPVDAALRQAMLETSRTPGFSHPYFWAPFQLIGPGETTF